MSFLAAIFLFSIVIWVKSPKLLPTFLKLVGQTFIWLFLINLVIAVINLFVSEYLGVTIHPILWKSISALLLIYRLWYLYKKFKTLKTLKLDITSIILLFRLGCIIFILTIWGISIDTTYCIGVEPPRPPFGMAPFAKPAVHLMLPPAPLEIHGPITLETALERELGLGNLLNGLSKGVVEGKPLKKDFNGVPVDALLLHIMKHGSATPLNPLPEGVHIRIEHALPMSCYDQVVARVPKIAPFLYKGLLVQDHPFRFEEGVENKPSFSNLHEGGKAFVQTMQSKEYALLVGKYLEPKDFVCLREAVGEPAYAPSIISSLTDTGIGPDYADKPDKYIAWDFYIDLKFELKLHRMSLHLQERPFYDEHFEINTRLGLSLRTSLHRAVFREAFRSPFLLNANELQQTFHFKTTIDTADLYEEKDSDEEMLF